MQRKGPQAGGFAVIHDVLPHSCPHRLKHAIHACPTLKVYIHMSQRQHTILWNKHMLSCSPICISAASSRWHDRPHGLQLQLLLMVWNKKVRGTKATLQPLASVFTGIINTLPILGRTVLLSASPKLRSYLEVCIRTKRKLYLYTYTCTHTHTHTFMQPACVTDSIILQSCREYWTQLGYLLIHDERYFLGIQ